jgi:hypothetical protein
MTGQTAGSDLKRLIGRWAERLVIGLVAAAALTYGGDYGVYIARGKPQDAVTVDRMLAVPLKGNKTEFDYQGSAPLACARALFPQGGEMPCWYLRRHKTQTDQL